MTKTKLRFEMYSFFDYTGIALHLEKMAAKGWLIQSITPLGWKYQRIEPSKFVFSISYAPRMSAFSSYTTEKQNTFYDFCLYTGWKLIGCFNGMNIFYTDQHDPVPLETEPYIELGSIHKAAKCHFLPLYFMLLSISLLPLCLSCFLLPANTFSLFTLVSWGIVFLLSIAEIIHYSLWYLHAKKAVAYGNFLPPSNAYSIHLKILNIICIICCALVFAADYKTVYFPIFAILIAYNILQIKIREYVKKATRNMKSSSTLNFVIYIIINMLLLIAMFHMIFYIM